MVCDSSTRNLCWFRNFGLDANKLDLVTANDVGSSSPNDVEVVIPCASNAVFVVDDDVDDGWRRLLPANVEFFERKVSSPGMGKAELMC